MSFENEITEPCIVQLGNVCPTPPPPAYDCDDLAFGLANPGLCDDFPRLIIKPGSLSLCQLQSKKLAAYLVTGSVEVLVEMGVRWSSSNSSKVTIGGVSGKATGISEGIVAISATFDGKSAFAQITVLPGDCCDNLVVGTVIVIDNSLSMSMNFNQAASTKLAWAKAAAFKLIRELNTHKDLIALMSFSNSGNLVAGFSNDVVSLGNAALSISSTPNRTNISDALSDAIDLLNSNPTLDYRAIVLISDLNNNIGVDPVPLADAFEETGGIVTVIGSRAFGPGFTLGQKIATSGFFLNAYNSLTSFAALNAASGLKGYYCAGNCNPIPGVAYTPALDWDGFINWDVMAGEAGNELGGKVDLIGGEFPFDVFDVLPGNGLYVDMAGSSAPYNGRLRSKTIFSFEAGETYRLTFKIAGPNRWSPFFPTVDLTIRAWTGSHFVNVTVTDNNMPFVIQTLEFTPSASFSDRINFWQVNLQGDPSLGLILDDVMLVRDPGGDDEVMLEDDFNNENPVIIPLSPLSPCNPEESDCYGYDYGYGCLPAPPPEQFPDPNPQPDTLEFSF